MRLYHERQMERGGALDVRDEEECFTSAGRRVGVYLSTEAVRGECAYAAEVAVEAVEEFEVTKEGAEHRVFVVPGAVVAELGFEAC